MQRSMRSSGRAKRCANTSVFIPLRCWPPSKQISSPTMAHASNAAASIRPSTSFRHHSNQRVDEATSRQPETCPRQSTSFVGRDAEVKTLSQLIREHQLVTLTGVGGVGKTRLAVQVATELEHEFDDGAWFVELAPVGSPASVPNAAATALGLRAQPGKSMTATIAETLAGRRMLVVLDNCEHVLDAAADLVEAISASSTTVSVVATSREGLGVGGEHLWAVPAFDLSDGASSAAVELFMERADAVVAGFRPGVRRRHGGRRRDLSPPRRNPSGNRADCGADVVDDPVRSAGASR